MIRRIAKPVALLTVVAVVGCCAAPQPAAAVDVGKPICTVAGLLNGLLGKACTAATHGKTLLKAGSKLLGGHLGGALQAIIGSGAGKALTFSAGLAAIGAWVFGGAKFALHATAAIVSSTTTPHLTSSWFSSFYWRMAAVSALLTLPFLFAAAVQALMRSDLSLLMRSAFGYLPLGFLAVAIAAPVTTLLLAGSDELSHIVSGAAGNSDSTFLLKASGVGALTLASKSPFLAFFVGLLTAAAALVLWCELLIRSAAVYVIVLMLPLFFAALVWPARRVWAVRSVEILVALILSKFAIVAVLALGGAAIGHSLVPNFAEMLAGATLILLAAFSPWALLRMLPLHELAAGAAGGLRAHAGRLPIAPAESAAEVAQSHADRLLGRGEAADEPPARATLARLDAPGAREPLTADDRSGGSPSAGNGGGNGGGDDGSEGGGEPGTTITDADTGPFDDPEEAPPVAAVMSASGEGTPASGASAAAASSEGGAHRARTAPLDTADRQDPASADADRLSQEVGLITRPGQTLHFRPQPAWSSDPTQADGHPPDQEAKAGATTSGEPPPDEPDPLPPRQEPQDGRL